jgi:hypothetical protein
MHRTSVCFLVLAATAAPSLAQQQFLVAGKRHLAPGERGTRALLFADLDRDGRLDLVTGNVGQDGLERGDGQARFTLVPGALPAETEVATAVVAGDLDRDGDLDLLIGNLAGATGSVRLLLNNGAGSFTDASARLPAGLPSVLDLALGDVDRDGDLDLVLAVVLPFPLPGPTARLLLNDGTGRFLDASNRLPQVTAATSRVAVGDADGDGDLDLLLANRPEQTKFGSLPGQDRLYRNDGTGTFGDATAALLPADNDATLGAAWADVDRDGDLDLIAMNDNGNRLYLNQGGGVLADATAGRVPPDPRYKSLLLVGDVNGDGAPDFLTAHYGVDGAADAGAQSRLFVNTGNGTFVDQTAWLPARIATTWGLALGDVDGDLDLDLLLGNDTQSNALFLNDGSGRFVDTTAAGLSFQVDQATSVALGDVNGDGAPDLMFGSWSRGHSRLYHNDGRGGFVDVTATHGPPFTDFTAAVAFGDADRDGDLDLLVAVHGNDLLYRNDGSGAFRSVLFTFPVSDPTRSVVFADVDRDGDLDLVTANGGVIPAPPSQDRLYLNNGNGTFTDATAARLPVDQDLTDAVVAADLDRDGDLDLLFGSLDLGPRLYLNNGTGFFSNATAARLPAGLFAQSAAVGDVDGDGDPDLVLGWRGQSLLLLNNGSGFFTDVTAQRMPVLDGYTVSPALVDVDLDLDLDLVLGNGGFPFGAGPQDSRLLINDGTGRFADVTGTRWPSDLGRVSEVVAGDVDRDGVPDLVLARMSRESLLLHNLVRHLEVPLLVRPGRTLAVDLYARDGGSSPRTGLVLLAAGELLPPVLVPPFGLLRVDPSRLLLSAALALTPPGSQATYSLPFPNDLSLVGARLHGQGLIVPGPQVADMRLTNGVRETVGPR